MLNVRRQDSAAPRFSSLPVAFGAAALVLSACGGGGSSAPATPRVAASVSPASVLVTIKIDEPAARTAAQSAKRRPAYLSPATQSITISVDGATPVAQNLTPSGGNCATPPFGATPVCTLLASAPAGSDTFTFVTYDGTGGTGNKLSQNTVVQTIVAGQANTVAVTLDGVPTGVLVTPYPNQPTVVQQGTGYAISGTTPVNVAVLALDADNNVIVGPGAPALAVTSNSANLHVASVANNPNEFTLTPVNEGTSATLNVSVTGGNGGSASSAVAFALQYAIPASLPFPLYAYQTLGTGTTGEIDIFPVGSVNNATPTRLTSSALDPNGGSVAADTNGTVFAEGSTIGSALYAVVSFNAAAVGQNATPTTQILAQFRGGPFATPQYMVVGPNHDLYVVASLDDGSYGLFVMQPNATGTAAGQYQEISGSNTTFDAANMDALGVAVDAAGYIYTAVERSSGGGASIAVFAPGQYGNVAPVRVISGSNTSLSEPLVAGVGGDGTLYVLDYGSAVVSVFAPGANGNVAPVRAFESPAMPYHGPMAVDAQGNVYALNESSLVGPFPMIVFGAASNGLVNPLFSISGSNAGSQTAVGISVPP